MTTFELRLIAKMGTATKLSGLEIAVREEICGPWAKTAGGIKIENRQREQDSLSNFDIVSPTQNRWQTGGEDDIHAGVLLDEKEFTVA